MSRLEQIATKARERFPEAVVVARTDLGQDVLVVDRDRSLQILEFLRDDPDASFDVLADVSAVDWLPREPRFHVHYHLYSFAWNERVRVKVLLSGDDPVVDSCVSVWPAANWQEREVYDLMGITFTGHPDLRRILMPDEWEGHPHRKDYPAGGVPVEYKIEPAYIGHEAISAEGRPSMGGIPSRLRRDRGKPSGWTWTGAPAYRIRRRGSDAQEPGS